MNKQEAQEQLTKVQAEMARLQEIIDTPEGRWRANDEEAYYYIDSLAYAEHLLDNRHRFDDLRYKSGNYFRTEEEAKKSNIYKVLNSEYEYYFAGVSDNFDDVPRDGSSEFHYCNFDWVCATDDHDYSQSFNYRWKRI